MVASFSLAVLASPECAWHHQNTAFTRFRDVSPPMVSKDGPELGVHASLYPVVGRRERAGLREPGVEVGEERPRRDQRGQRPPRLPEPLVGVDPPPVDERGVLEEVGQKPHQSR